MARLEEVVADLERRISELENERAVRELLSRFGYVMDFGSVDEFADLFTSDGAIDISMGASYGKHAVSERWEGVDRLRDFLVDPDGRWDKTWYGNVMHVQGNNLEITITGDEALATGYALSVISRDGALSIMGASANRWHLHKVHGRWRIKERKFRAVGHDEYAAMVLGPGRKRASDRG